MRGAVAQDINGIRHVRRIVGSRRVGASPYEEAGLLPSYGEGPSIRPHPLPRPNDLVTADFDQRRGGISVRGPDGAYILGNRGVPVRVPQASGVTTAASQWYQLMQVHWNDEQARPGLLSLGFQFPQPTTLTLPATWASLVARLQWSQGSSSNFTADVDLKMGTAFPITFSSLTCMVRKDYQVTSPSSDAEVIAFGGLAPVGYGGFGVPNRSLQVVLETAVGPNFTGVIPCPPFSRRVNVSYTAPETSPLTIDFLLGGFGYATTGTSTWWPLNTPGPIPPIVLPNDCYGLLFTSDDTVVVNATFDLDIR